GPRIPDPGPRIPDPGSRAPDPGIAPTSLALALSGFAAMGMEIVWFRHFSILLGEFRAVFALLLAVILLAMGAGALAGGYLHVRMQRPVHLLMLVQGLFVASTLAGLASANARAISDAAVSYAARHP